MTATIVYQKYIQEQEEQSHVTGQICIAMIFLGTGYMVYYYPIIGVSAIITGVFVGLVAQVIIKTEVIKKQLNRNSAETTNSENQDNS